jgi:diguanylate cyclase (GGDEF)-like protein/PAS domain S-box-containing protein
MAIPGLPGSRTAPVLPEDFKVVDRYELAAQGADNGLWDWDLITSRLHYSPGWISMLGCADGDCGNTSDEWFRRIHPEDLEPVRREIAGHLEKGSTQFEIQHRMLHEDGCYRWMSCQGVIARDETGKPVRITGFHADITADVVVDALTRLPNRQLLLNRLARSIDKAGKQKDFLYAVLVADLDLFESGINHLETLNGDALIVAAARRFESALRTKDGFSREGRSDLVARSGGEEFIILLEGLSELQEAKKVADRLLKAVLAPFAFNGKDVTLSPSIGVALSATGYRDPEDALRDAAAALYRAKSLGKSRCEVFDTAILESTQNRQDLEKDLHGALSRNELVVFYQPIISLTSNRVEGLEALVRWNHPSRGMLSPAAFIPVAERTGLISPISQWVLQQACRQLKNWQNDPRISKDLWVSVNLSGAQFKQPSLAKEIREALLETGLDAGRLMLELTEGMAMEHPEAARKQLMQLRVMGARIAIDDFGTGYSSLAHLRRFPLDFLKIDHTFVKSIEVKSDVREIIRTIRMLAHQLGLQIIIEGIENSGQLDLIRSMGCEYAQGFLFSRPVSSGQAELFLLDGFAFGEDGTPAAISVDANGPKTDPPIESSPGTPVRNRGRGPCLSLAGALREKWVLAAFTILILVVTGGILVTMNRFNSPLGSNTSPAESFTPAAPPEQAAPSSPVVKTPDAPEHLQASAAAPAAAKARPAEAVYRYRVEHDHRIGSCTGTLKLTRNAISFAAEKGKDNFSFQHALYSYSLDGDQLTIRAESRVYRLKSATAKTSEENRAELQGIVKNLSRLYSLQPSQNR